MSTLVEIVVAVLALGGALFVLTSAVAMFRVRDAISRVNVLSPATGAGIPAIVLAAFVQQTYEQGFDVLDAFKALVAVAAFIIISSLASNTLGRAAYRSGAPVDPATRPNDLAEEPGDLPPRP